MKKSFISICVGLIVSFSYQNSSAKVYSTIIKVESIGSFSDCYNVTYALFEDHNNTIPTDDTRIGIFNTVVGSDCQPTFKAVGPVKDLSSFSKIPDSLNEQPNRTFYLSEEHNWNNRQLKFYPLTEIPDTIPNTSCSLPRF
jgi:hypothetical protein